MLTETVNDDLIAFSLRIFPLARRRRQPRPPHFHPGNAAPGSTLVEQIIASHSRVEGTSELPYIGRLTKSLNRNRADGMRYPRSTQRTGAPPLQPAGPELPGYGPHAPGGGTPLH